MGLDPIYQKSSAAVYVYPHNQDAIALKPRGSTQQLAGSRTPGGQVQLVSVETAKAMGGIGTWSATLKVPRGQERDWEESVTDGDWVDVILGCNGRRYHVVRGIVVGNDPVGGVGGSGAETRSYKLFGFDHQAVFDTLVYFSTYSEENVFGGAALRASVLTGQLFGLGGVRETVSGILYGFLQELSGYGRALWTLPGQMPAAGGSPFAAACARLFDSRSDTPQRIASGASLMAFENRTIWQLAQEWSEGQFNELWCDLARAVPRDAAVNADVSSELSGFEQYDAYALSDSDALEPDTTQMAVFMRRRPFPTGEDPEGIEQGPWSRLPTATILPTELLESPLHIGGEERVNVVEVAPLTLHELAVQSTTLFNPLVDAEDVARRGVRPMSMQSRYHANLAVGVSDADLALSQRQMLVDWHCLNPRFLSGQQPLRTLRPGIRVGSVACVTTNPTRLRGRDASDDATFYVEQVSHRWKAPGFGSTTLGVTRGFRGGDDALYSALNKARANFRPLAPSRVVLAGDPATLGQIA